MNKEERLQHIAEENGIDPLLVHDAPEQTIEALLHVMPKEDPDRPFVEAYLD